MNGLEVVPVSERAYVLSFGDNGEVTEEPQPRPSRELPVVNVERHELPDWNAGPYRQDVPVRGR
jgi:hypothetical protein